jgi:DNA polymerase
MDSTADAEPADELRELTRLLRTQLRRYVSLGAWAAPGGPTAAYAGTGAADAAEADAAAEPVATEPVAAEPVAAEPVEPAVAAAEFAPDAAISGPAGFDDAFAAAREADDAASLMPPREPIAAPEQGELLAPLGRRTLAQIREELGECTRCKLHATRKKIVFGVGAEDAPLMFVGEAPGEQEDRRGEPFVGPAGELLDKMIEAMGWTRQTVYIANTTKCRPPGNRNPQPDELAQCTPFLDAQIRAIAPRIIVTLGRPASNHVLGKDAPISSLRGRFHDRTGVKVMPTFHPAYLLRDPDKKKDTWSDLKQVIAELERLGIKPPRPPRG